MNTQKLARELLGIQDDGVSLIELLRQEHALRQSGVDAGGARSGAAARFGAGGRLQTAREDFERVEYESGMRGRVERGDGLFGWDSSQQVDSYGRGGF